MKNCFVDKNHKIMMDYYDFLESGQQNPTKIEKKMKEFIKIDPAFLDSYLYLFDFYQTIDELDKANELLNQAFQIALKTITDKKGNWPEELLWGFIENRHIIRTLLNKAMNHWAYNENELALEILRKLLRSNPMDNVGARNYILAIRLGMSFAEFEKEMASEYGYDGNKLIEFSKKMEEFPDEFDWWFEVVKEEN